MRWVRHFAPCNDPFTKNVHSSEGQKIGSFTRHARRLEFILLYQERQGVNPNPIRDNLIFLDWIKNGYFLSGPFYSITSERGTTSIPFSFILGIISLMYLSVEG